MLKKRIIPVLMLMNGWIVQSFNFKTFKKIGNPEISVSRISDWCSDELIFLDISRNKNYDYGRDDISYNIRNKNFLSIIKKISRKIFVPFAVGGKIKTIEDVKKRLSLGAEKVIINSVSVEKPDLIKKIINDYGSQALTVSIDVKKNKNNYEIYINNGSKKVLGLSLTDHIKNMQRLGVGEFFINSIDNDGMKKGYDKKLIDILDKNLKSTPTIICGGVGKWSDLLYPLKKKNIDAVAAANIFHHFDQSVYLAKKYLNDKKMNIRKANLKNYELNKIL